MVKKMNHFVIFLLMVLCYCFSDAIPAIRCRSENVLTSIPTVDCKDRTVILAYCESCGPKRRKLILDATKVVQNPDYSKIYGVVCTKSFFITS